MPEIDIQHVVSFNSADKNNPAENLLKADGSHRWKSAAPGEKTVSCVLQFSKCSQINSIDIGNEGSAFVEILVGKSAATSDKDFEVLLVASSFMSPLDSRNGTNRTSVRMFGPDKLNKVTAAQKWDRVKIVCSQPFTKTTQYGLSFIKFHSPPEANNSGEDKTKKLGAFTLKSASDDEDENIRVGSLFASRGKPETVPTPTGAAVIRQASRLAEEHVKVAAAKATTNTQSKATTVAAGEKRQSKSPISTQALKKAKATTSDDDSDTEEEEPASKTPLKKQSTSITSVSSNASSKKDEPRNLSALKRTRTEPARASPAKDFSKLMDGAVFVLSGFQNPFRGELRDKAMEMGAKYRPDWGKGCTHLICAFQNTPKYQQVSGKGKIVTKSWILDTYKMKKKLPWRKYRLGDAESPDESSEEEEDIRPAAKTKMEPEKKTSTNQNKNDTKTSKGNDRGAKPQKGVKFYSASDTEEDETGPRKQASKAVEKKRSQEITATKVTKDEKDPYDVATDEEGEEKGSGNTDTVGGDAAGSDSGLPDLPDFFSDKHFFFYGSFDAADRRMLTRYVAAFDGEEEDYMSKKVNYVVTQSKWDDNFDEALSENPNLVFVKPKWIFACHEKNKLLPYQPYVVVPA